MKTSLVEIECNSTACNAARSVIPSTIEDGIMMWMPAGKTQITPSKTSGGIKRPVTVVLDISERDAEKIEAQRKVLTSIGRKPFFSIQHATEIAAFWPSEFFWDKRIDATGSLAEGIWAKGEWTRAGKEAVEGKDFRTFSPKFYVDEARNNFDKPATVLCNEDACANMGALENDPAFQNMSPLWCGRAGSNQEFTRTRELNAGAPGRNQNNRNKHMKKPETLAELQARNEELELTINGLSAKNDEVSRARLEAARSELEAIEARIETVKVKEQLEAANTRDTARIERDAEAGVQRMIDTGKIKPLQKELQASYKEKFIKDPSLIALVAGASEAVYQPGGGAARPGAANLSRQMTPHSAAIEAGGAHVSGSYTAGWDIDGAMKRYTELIAANANVDYRDPDTKGDAYRRKGKLALEAATFYKTDLEPNIKAWEHVDMRDIGKRIGLMARNNGKIELNAADYSDDNAPSNVLGVLSGTLVLQRTLPKFAYNYPELMNMYTDFSDTPGLYNQTENTHIVQQPAVVKYDPTTDGTGRPKGWSTVSQALVTDAPITLTDHIAVPIVFGQNVLSATNRRLFDEQSELAIKAIAGYFTAMATSLFTKANYPSYATANGTTVKTAYPTYIKGQAEFSMSDLDLLDAAFTDMKVPEASRFLMLNTAYYAKLRGDPRLSFLYAASAKDIGAGAGEFLMEAKLPKLSGFSPYKSPYLPLSLPAVNPTTNNIVGFAGQKAAIILKSRLPTDFSQALGSMIPGSITTVTDPDTKISVMLVQYVNLTQNYAEWRPEVILGTAVGDARAGLVLTSA